MLTQLSTVKDRLAILQSDTQYDTLLTSAIKALSARFDKETNRTLARTTDITDEFAPNDTEIPVRCYPIESVTKFELKTDDTSGWVEQTGTKFLIRSACVISLQSAICHLPSPICRVTYTGGYVLPGTTPGTGQTPLPDDLEQAVVEQVAYWFQRHDKLGVKISWPSGGTYQQFAAQDLLPAVQSVLNQYRRLTI